MLMMYDLIFNFVLVSCYDMPRGVLKIMKVWLLLVSYEKQTD